MKPQLPIGTRASPLAQAQARMVAQAIMAAHPHITEDMLPLSAMQTKGDRDVTGPMSAWGFKGLFTKELDDALLDSRVALAVHSMKDMPSLLPDGMVIGAVLPRADVRDAWISTKHPTLNALPVGSVVGTSSLRRAAQLRALRPDIRIIEFRGNVQTRLAKLADGVADATLLACAGLDRLGMEAHIAERIDTSHMLPAVAQGIIAITCRANDDDMRAMLAAIHHAPTAAMAEAERAMLCVLDGSCRTPIAGLATTENGMLTLHGALYAPDGTSQCRAHASAPIEGATKLGMEVGARIKADAPASMLDYGSA